MKFEKKSTAVALVTCDKGGQHSGEYISYVCLNPICRNECLLCCICKATKHHNHQTFPLKTLFDDLEFKTKRLERKSEIMVLSEIDKAQSTSQEGIRSLVNYIQVKLQKMEDKMMDYFDSLRNEAKQHFNNRPIWTNEVEKLRFESDKDHLELKIQEVLDNIQVNEGKIQKINEEFFGSKSTESIDGFMQSFLETLKNMHVSISNQYSKMYNPLSQPHHLRKDYFNNPQSMNQINLMNQQQAHTNNKALSVKNSETISTRNQDLANYDTASFSSKIIQPNESVHNVSHSRQNSDIKLQQNPNRNPTFSGFHNYVEQIQQSTDNISTKNNITPINNQQTFSKENIGVKSDNNQQKPFFAMQQSTVSYSIPNVSQLQQMQFDLQRQINKQQQLLSQLQAQSYNTQTTTSTPMNNAPYQQNYQQQILQQKQFQDQMPQQQQSLFTSKDLHKNWQTTQASQVNSQALSNIMRSGSPSPPQRLMYYSSLFQQHRQSISQSPYSNQQRFSSQPKVNMTPQNNGQSPQNSGFTPLNNYLNNSQLYQQNNNLNRSSQLNNSAIIQNEKKSNFGLSNYYEQDIDYEDFENHKFKDLPKSQERQFRFRFNKEYKHENIDCFDNNKKIKGTSDNFETRLALFSPSVETKPIREFHWAVKIVSCKSFAYSSPLAVGLCLKKHVENTQYKFVGEDKQSSSGALRTTQSYKRLSSFGSTMMISQSGASTVSSKNEISPHGCYLLTAAGFIRNHTEPKQDMKKVSVRFDQGDTLLCHFNPFRKYLKIKNKNSGEYCMINIDFTPGDQLFPCARISYCQDIVEILDDVE